MVKANSIYRDEVSICGVEIGQCRAAGVGPTKNIGFVGARDCCLSRTRGPISLVRRYLPQRSSSVGVRSSQYLNSLELHELVIRIARHGNV